MKPTPGAKAPADVSSIAALQKHLGRALADCQLLFNSASKAQAIARLLTVAVLLIEQDELRGRLEALETKLFGGANVEDRL
jgi:hypothetical protein